jgi:hypothetical protein
MNCFSCKRNCASSASPDASGQSSAPPSWRLLITGPSSGAQNMAVDEALLESAIAGGPPVLRIYAWQPAAVSLGYFQPLDDSIDRSKAGLRPVPCPTHLRQNRQDVHRD